MDIPDFNTVVEFRRLTAPGEKSELLEMLQSEKSEGQLGNMVGWITTNVAPELRPYHQLVLPTGDVLDVKAIQALAETPEFEAWEAARA